MKAYKNEDREIYRQPTTDYGSDGNDTGMEPSVFVTKTGDIGFNHHGTVFTKSIKEWVQVAQGKGKTPYICLICGREKDQ